MKTMTWWFFFASTDSILVGYNYFFGACCALLVVYVLRNQPRSFLLALCSIVGNKMAGVPFIDRADLCVGMAWMGRGARPSRERMRTLVCGSLVDPPIVISIKASEGRASSIYMYGMAVK